VYFRNVPSGEKCWCGCACWFDRLDRCICVSPCQAKSEFADSHSVFLRESFCFHDETQPLADRSSQCTTQIGLLALGGDLGNCLALSSILTVFSVRSVRAGSYILTLLVQPAIDDLSRILPEHSLWLVNPYLLEFDPVFRQGHCPIIMLLRPRGWRFRCPDCQCFASDLGQLPSGQECRMYQDFRVSIVRRAIHVLTTQQRHLLLDQHT
jgi:hypothetical protein